MTNFPRIDIAGEGALILYLDSQASPQLAATIAALLPQIKTALGETLVDLIPSYNSVLVQYQPLLTDHFAVRSQLQQILSRQLSQQDGHDSGKLVKLPVWYSQESGPDLAMLAENAGLSTEQVIELHQQSQYRVYAIGFAPGFAYLGEVDGRIAAPRLATPRKKVPTGAVAIADRQTAVYPAPSPGGWNLIGLCPQLMFDKSAQPPMPVEVGDKVQFYAIDKAEFLRLGGKLGAFE
ncbi:5-oxoprolinase subunit PxpB [Lacimicrobium alkaliphilum]|uniref:Allophanate hydrolase n=1 Tax=Lacimicrobium alkaliphilum TaxID=1526571 RepID=A0A0U3ALQ3_9ALTE|nr:5-oxoprolinase subunit PxpB [Lacimicrobium alkaliphilum]ALS99713.1 allophanate hydrolase [Lacimicrobium alkaliphilum]